MIAHRYANLMTQNFSRSATFLTRLHVRQARAQISVKVQVDQSILSTPGEAFKTLASPRVPHKDHGQIVYTGRLI